jgi:hypothetical protein
MSGCSVTFLPGALRASARPGKVPADAVITILSMSGLCYHRSNRGADIRQDRGSPALEQPLGKLRPQVRGLRLILYYCFFRSFNHALPGESDHSAIEPYYRPFGLSSSIRCHRDLTSALQPPEKRTLRGNEDSRLGVMHRLA